MYTNADDTYVNKNRSIAMIYTEYFELIQRKYDTGKIDYERYCFLMDKLTQWYYVASEREDG